MHSNLALGSVAVMLGLSTGHLQADEWAQLHGIERTKTGFEVTASPAWLLSQPPEANIPSKQCCLLLEVRTPRAAHMRIYWRLADQHLNEGRAVSFHVPATDKPVLVAANLDQQGTFDGIHQFRFDPHLPVGGEFEIKRLEFVRPDEIPPHLVPGLVGFQCFTSKLHYQPGERIEYQAKLSAGCYPDRQSSKIIEVILSDAAGRQITKAVQQYGIFGGARFKDLQGVLDVPAPLTPGKYVLTSTSRDQRSGLTLTARHEFGVQGPADPFLYETPFKFVKDFTFIKGPEDRWHVFSITGDPRANHDWGPDGQERTFSHASSKDLRDWTIHPPVISISNDTRPDGNGRFKDRNVWAPHVIENDGKYWMFYTSVNQHVSQSVSLATSPDLFEWTDYEQNPVFTLEGVEWANWIRNGWSDCRDPCVLVDGDKFYLYVTANVKPPGEVGGIVVAESDDLFHWGNPAIAVRGKNVSESPQVWKDGETYYMTTSATGSATYTSKHPARGWTRSDFPRPDTQAAEKYVPTSPRCAEEVVRMDDGTFLIAAFTWRHQGNSIYFFRMKTKDGVPITYESPWEHRSSFRSASKIKVSPLAPRSDEEAHLHAVGIKAPWMSGEIRFRFPETVETDTLDFIDHHRDDMPPRVPSAPLARAWEKSDGGSVWFEWTYDNQVVGGRLSPNEDDVDLEFWLRNQRIEPVTLALQFCPVLANTMFEDHSLERTWVHTGGQWRKMAETDRGSGKRSLCHYPVESGPPVMDGEVWGGSKDVVDLPVVAVTSEDGKYVFALSWPRPRSILSNAELPCVHADPALLECPSGKVARIRGKLYLMEGSLDDLRRRVNRNGPED